ncbi:hypothetical protein DL89DRAFT_281776 [Linderina pennispora]|uniref:Peptidase S1 domain-containing protein n=1 Tax=Linderina pennispora TaxID=61395 RepID=A0A1Y1WI40_9FUNG|nr:uncharacterized protein DL89DRAFT_281776 [Linderina pennispora]ORX73142.1 hypothetical protein DL89DRAFT_281776 [Linderina pennispora]
MNIIVTGLLLFPIQPSIAFSRLLQKRETSAAQAKIPHGGILLKNGRQTSCELALITNRLAFAAASCFDVDTYNNANGISRYQVALDSGGPPITKEIVSVDKVTINPQYNSTTYASNLAVVFFNSKAKEAWSNKIDVFPQELANRAYVRHSLGDVENQVWNSPAVINGKRNDDGCKQASVQYASNPADLWCTTRTTASPVNTTCHVPYGIAYGIINSDMVITALYSHSAVYGGDFCSSSKTYSYYTVLSNFIKWANTIIPNPISVFSSDGQSSASNDDWYGFENATAPIPRGFQFISGDLYARYGSSEPNTTTSNHLVPTGTVAAHDTFLSSSANQDEPSGNVGDSSVTESQGLGKAQIVALSVSIPVAIIIISLMSLFFYRRWRRYRSTTSCDSESENHGIVEVTHNVERPDEPTARPPSYTSTDGIIDDTSGFDPKNDSGMHQQ